MYALRLALITSFSLFRDYEDRSFADFRSVTGSLAYMHQLPVTAESKQGPNAMNSNNDTLANVALNHMLTTIFPVSFVRIPTSTNLAQKEHMVKQRTLSSFMKH